jgi:hypothetical protein
MSYGTGEPNDLRRLAENLTARALADQAEITRRYQALLERVGAGEIDPIRLRAEYNELVQERSAQLMSELTALGAEYYRAILDLNRKYVEDLLDQLGAGRVGGATTAAHDDAGAPTTAHGEISMSGGVGEVATASFVVENPEDAPGEVRFFVSDVVDEGGNSCGTIEVEPAQLWLAAGESAEVNARVNLVPERFEAGGRYEGKILARGTRDFEVTVHVIVLAPPAEPD